ncbi:conserved Plasmodium membrane protein, unknown function [Plasmodium gonderi]|uniref:MARVEL domain-containing protein n=1 Tax=Plasmodium gonderi TaxID=77519 RepID=A0A1Y1JI21_PLAGO|nr:conserved Plasmodium membrane protein, unknown function [Plasmodium gonderi]GAW80837.1 conserved Plasmodium membrane protein, unknown function [Plasmodium gonderi]
MEIQRDIVTFLFGIVASLLLFVVGGMFNNTKYIFGCYIFLGFVLTTYTILAFLIPRTKKSKNFVFSYAVSTACMFLISLMSHIVITDAHTAPACAGNVNHCTKYIFASIFGFVSTLSFLVASILTFKLANVW